RLPPDQRERRVGDRHLLGEGDLAQPRDDLPERDELDVVPLDAGENRGRQLLRVGGGEQELDVPGRLFERLEQGVEGGAGEHVDFVDDVDLVAVARRQVPGCLAQGADVVDAVVRGGVDLLHVDVGAGGDVGAGPTYAARLGRRPLLAVERAGKDACAGGF